MATAPDIRSRCEETQCGRIGRPCEHHQVSTIGQTLRFRHSSAITVAAVIAAIAAIPVLAASPWFAFILLIPLAVGLWSWRAGTDADEEGLLVRAAFGSTKVRWRDVAELAVDPRGTVFVRTTGGGVIRLPAVPATELPRLIAASGQELETSQ
jgi:hypothetical protein